MNKINLDFILRATDPGGMYKDQAFSLSVLDDVSDNPLPPPPPEEPTNPLTVSVSDTGWDLYKDVLSDQFAPSEWSDILGSSLSETLSV